MPPSAVDTNSELRSLRQRVAQLSSLLDSVLERVYLCPKDLLQRYNISPRTFYRRIKPKLPPPPPFPGGVWPLGVLVSLEEAGQLPDPV